MTYKAVLDKIIPMMKKPKITDKREFKSMSEAVQYALMISKKKRKKK